MRDRQSICVGRGERDHYIVPQKPIEGVSLAYTFTAENADKPGKHYTQYFEMFGNRALYHDGWIACCRHGRLPWINVGSAEKRPFAFTGKIDKVRFDFGDGTDLSPAEKLEQHIKMD